jgi:hypothetical protein
MSKDLYSLHLFDHVTDVDADRKLAIEADIGAAGGQQIVGHALGLADDPQDAGKLLSNKLNQNGRHRLTDAEVWKIRKMAKEKSGRSRLTELENQLLNFEGKWLTTEDLKARRKKERAALLTRLQQLEQEDE